MVLKFVDSKGGAVDAFKNMMKTQNNAHCKAKSLCIKGSGLPAAGKPCPSLRLQLLAPKFGRGKIGEHHKLQHL